MILGIKVGPDKQSFRDLAQTNAPFAEVWFNINHADDYNDLFSELTRRKMQVGLHFWGVVDSGFATGFGYPDQSILHGSSNLIKTTIDIAATHKFHYVNIHPGSRSLVKMDLDHEDYTNISKPIPLPQAQSIFLEYVSILDQYAKKRGIVLTVETVSKCVAKTNWHNPSSRQKPLNIFQLPVASIQAAGSHGIAIANDFGHTATDPVSANRQNIWKFLYETTKKLAPVTRLIHLEFLVPPYNGTDFHDHLDNPLLETNHAIPNKQQMIELLRLFQNRDDVWILTEPNGRHGENYFLAQKILEEALQN